MEKKLSILVLSVLLPNILFCNSNNLNSSFKPLNQDGSSSGEILITGNVIYKVYTLPPDSSHIFLPIKFIPVSHQNTIHTIIWQSQFCYFQKNGLSLNNPVSCYKISLSAFTSGG
jgi:hypothetical protein